MPAFRLLCRGRKAIRVRLSALARLSALILGLSPLADCQSNDPAGCRPLPPAP